MKQCLNCETQIDLLSDFCSEKCSDEWQIKNEKCSKCGKEMNLLEEEYTIKNNGERALVLCLNCGHGGYSE